MSVVNQNLSPANQQEQEAIPKKKPAWKLPAWLGKIDRGILALLIVFVLTLPLFTPRIYASDEIKYFSYLHSAFFDQDVDFTNEYTYFYELNPKKNANIKEGMIDKRNEKGLPVNEGPVGSAILWSPFYLVAHGVTSAGSALGLKSLKPDGFSTPYVWAITLASLLYGFGGMVFGYLFARNFMPGFYAALGTITIWLGTGVIFYMSLTPPMSHANSLFILSLWLWLWYRTREWRFDENGKFIAGVRRGSMWLLLGVLGGLATMVREQDGVVMIIAAGEALFLYRQLLWSDSVKSLGKLSQRLKAQSGQLLKLFGRNLWLLLGFGLTIIPQLIVYLALNGRIGPGKTVGDKLQFLNSEVPGRFLGLLFLNPDHGLFWWWPVLLPAIAGLCLMLGNRQHRLVPILLLLALVAEIYISSAFQTWTMRGSFGPRRLIGISAIYIVGLGYLTYWLAEVWRKVPRKVLVGLAALFIAWNFGLIIQFSAIRTEETRKELDPARVVVDQFTAVPGKLIETAQKFIFEREKFYKK